MAAQKYTYSISMDFPNHAVATDRLLSEVRASAIATAVDYINTSSDDCDVWFKDALSVGDETVLDGIVGVHSGEPLPSECSKVVLSSEDGQNVSVEPDGRLVVVNFPADEGTYMWLTGAGDDIENGVRGGGPEITMEFADTVRTEPEVKTLDVQFMEWIQLHDGQITVTNNENWAIGDRWDWGVLMPATEVVPNATNEGNCNVVNPQGEPGQPDSYIIVPAMGDGAFDVDLDAATPVPASGAGYWEFDWRTDVVTPSANPGGAGWYLLAVDAPMAYFMRRVNVPIHRAGNFDFDAYKAERIYRRWKLRLVVSKKSDGPGKLSGWIVCFREYNT